MKIKELCCDERPREKMLKKGAKSLSNSELLAILLRTGRDGKNVIGIAQELLAKADGQLSNIASMSIDAMRAINGIGPSKAVTIAAAFELGTRYSAELLRPNDTSVTSPEIVYRLMFQRLIGLDHEECWVLFLNRAKNVLSIDKITSGSLTNTSMDTQGILRKAIEKKADGIILVHNHPSGNPKPSKGDIIMTESLRRGSNMLDISLVDHVIIADGSYYSFADEEVVDCKQVLSSI